MPSIDSDSLSPVTGHQKKEPLKFSSELMGVGKHEQPERLLYNDTLVMEL